MRDDRLQGSMNFFGKCNYNSVQPSANADPEPRSTEAPKPETIDHQTLEIAVLEAFSSGSTPKADLHSILPALFSLQAVDALCLRFRVGFRAWGLTFRVECRV